MRQNNQKRILIVDEDELSLALIRASLETQCWTAFSAFNCDQAVDHSVRNLLNLVICDIDVRANTGIHIQTLIRSIPENREVPFLFTSASQKPDVISRRLSDRNVFFVRKPFEHEAFVELVEFAMLRPNAIRSHIEKMHLQQGLKRPRLVTGNVSAVPAAVPYPFQSFDAVSGG